LIKTRSILTSRPPTTPAYPNKVNPEGVNVPYSREEKSTIDAKFVLKKNYYKTQTNIYPACNDTLDEHVNNAYKVAPPTIPPTTGWNVTLSICNIFDQMASTYDKPTPDAMHQNNVKTLPKSYSNNAPTSKRLRRWPRTRTPLNNSSSTQSISSHVADCTNVT